MTNVTPTVDLKGAWAELIWLVGIDGIDSGGRSIRMCIDEGNCS
jgi:hypothetical protein